MIRLSNRRFVRLNPHEISSIAAQTTNIMPFSAAVAARSVRRVQKRRSRTEKGSHSGLRISAHTGQASEVRHPSKIVGELGARAILGRRRLGVGHNLVTARERGRQVTDSRCACVVPAVGSLDQITIRNSCAGRDETTQAGE